MGCNEDDGCDSLGQKTGVYAQYRDLGADRQVTIIFIFTRYVIARLSECPMVVASVFDDDGVSQENTSLYRAETKLLFDSPGCVKGACRLRTYVRRKRGLSHTRPGTLRSVCAGCVHGGQSSDRPLKLPETSMAFIAA